MIGLALGTKHRRLSLGQLTRPSGHVCFRSTFRVSFSHSTEVESHDFTNTPDLSLVRNWDSFTALCTASGHFLPCAFILSVENSTEMLFFQISTKSTLLSSPLQSEGPSAVDLSGRSFAFWKASSREILQSAANDSLLSPSHHHQHRLLTDISLSINIWHLSLFPSSLIIIWKNSFCHLRFLVDHSSAAAAVVADGGNCLPSLLTPTSDASQISG